MTTTLRSRRSWSISAIQPTFVRRVMKEAEPYFNMVPKES
jgi:hypothetical protein